MIAENSRIREEMSKLPDNPMEAAELLHRELGALKSRYPGAKKLTSRMAERYKVSRTKIVKTIKFLQLDEDVQCMLKAGNLSASSAELISQVAKVSQKKLANKIFLESLPRSQVRIVVDRINSEGLKLDKPVVGKIEKIDPDVLNLVEGIEDTFGVTIESKSTEADLSVVVKMWDKDIVKDLLIVPKSLNSQVQIDINILGPQHELTRAIEMNLSCAKSTDFNVLLGIVCDGFEMVKRVREMRSKRK